MLLDDIATYLQTCGLGTVNTNIFKAELPDQPDNCIAIFEYAGNPPEDTHDGKGFDNPGLQVRVRNVSYSAARALMESVYGRLHGLSNTTLGGTRILLIRAVQAPFPLGPDRSRRHELAQNYIVKKAR